MDIKDCQIGMEVVGTSDTQYGITKKRMGWKNCRNFFRKKFNNSLKEKLWRLLCKS